MGQRKHFLGFFTVDIQHKTLPTLIPLSFYVFQDSTSPHSLLSYSASIHLGIVEFKIPNKAKANAMVRSSHKHPIEQEQFHLKTLYVIAHQLKRFQQCLYRRSPSSNAKNTERQVISGPRQHSRTTTTQQMMIRHRYTQ